MPAKSLMCLVPALVTAGLPSEPAAADAAGCSRLARWAIPVAGSCFQQKRKMAGGYTGLWQIGPSLPKPL